MLNKRERPPCAIAASRGPRDVEQARTSAVRDRGVAR
jgi:hypothetical protein